MRRFVIAILTGEHVSVHKTAHEPFTSIAREIHDYGASIKVERVYADGEHDPEAMDGQIVIIVTSTDAVDPRPLFRRTIGKHAPEAIYTVTELKADDEPPRVA